MDQNTHNEQKMQSEQAAAEQTQATKVYPVVVYTPQELEAAQKSGAERILVKGQMASKLETALKTVRSLSGPSMNALALVVSGAALLAPFTGGVSLGAAGTVMGTLGAAVTAAAIAAISAIGLSLVIAVIKGYDEVKISGGGLELVIKKHGQPQAPNQSQAQASTVDGQASQANGPTTDPMIYSQAEQMLDEMTQKTAYQQTKPNAESSTEHKVKQAAQAAKVVKTVCKARALFKSKKHSLAETTPHNQKACKAHKQPSSKSCSTYKDLLNAKLHRN